MAKGNSKYLQIAAYVMLIAIFVFAISIARNCGRIKFEPREGFSGGDTLDIALLYGPGGYYIYEDTLAGINLDIAREFSAQTGVPVKIWPVNDPAEGMDKLAVGVFDVVASLPLDNYIKNRFRVSESIFFDRLVLIQMGDSASGETPVNSSLDLHGKKVSVASGSSAINRLQNLSEEIGGDIVISEEPDMSDELLVLQVASGNIPLAVVNERVAREVAKNYPGLKYDSTVSFTQFQVWVFNSNDSVAENLFDSWFETFRDTQDYRRIIDKY